MKLSVLIPFYNQECFVDQTLRSVMSQLTNFDFEVLVGDDGSTDGTWEKIQQWQRRFPDIIHCFLQDRTQNNETHSRICFHKAFLLKKAIGEYFCFLDGDDFLCDNKKFQNQIEILDNPKNYDCSMCAHNVNLFFERSNRSYPQFGDDYKDGKYSSWYYTAFLYFHSSSLIYRNIFHGKIENRLLELYFDDVFITTYLSCFGKIFYLSDTMSCWRRHDHSTIISMKPLESEVWNFLNYDILCRIAPQLRFCLQIQFYKGSIAPVTPNATLSYCMKMIDRYPELQQSSRLAKIYSFQVRSLFERFVYVLSQRIIHLYATGFKIFVFYPVRLFQKYIVNLV